MLKRQEEGRPFTFYHYMLDLTEGPCIYKRISGCGSGTGRLHLPGHNGRAFLGCEALDITEIAGADCL